MSDESNQQNSANEQDLNRKPEISEPVNISTSSPSHTRYGFFSLYLGFCTEIIYKKYQILQV